MIIRRLMNIKKICVGVIRMMSVFLAGSCSNDQMTQSACGKGDRVHAEVTSDL